MVKAILMRRWLDLQFRDLKRVKEIMAEQLEPLQLNDMQGLLARGFGKLRHACYVLMAFGTSAGARAWLHDYLPNITPASARAERAATNLAFTHAGLSMFELNNDALSSFPRELVEGMTTAHRQRILGDVGESAPENWGWGGPNNAVIHAALFIYAKNQEQLEAAYQSARATFAANAITEIKRLDTTELTDFEHFGFRDGISQPIVPGLPKRDLPMNTVPAGEFFLGYKNAYGKMPDSPGLSPAGKRQTKYKTRSPDLDLGLNGSYVVFRQLEQNVEQFWRFMLARAETEEGAIRLAAKMVGRWPSGAPLALSPDIDKPALAEANTFAYAKNDADGMACPFGSHIRRTNPRDALEETEVKLAADIVNRHRILRRGRSYGPPLVASFNPHEMLAALQSENANLNMNAGEKRGLMFICLNANIQRQFEFIQHTWCNNTKFETLYDEVDAISGATTDDASNYFTVPCAPVRERVSDVPRFVTVRGGAYFFMPGIAALRYLASKRL
jgi:Dyp-type peroxidase family